MLLQQEECMFKNVAFYYYSSAPYSYLEPQNEVTNLLDQHKKRYLEQDSDVHPA